MWGKTVFDYCLAIILLPFLLPIIIVLILVSTVDTGEFGLFQQTRIGQYAKPFSIFKIRSMKGVHDSTITTSKSHQITKFGSFIRQTKLDELPQIFNILLGNMSFVGPRPDVIGYADQLKGDDKIILEFKPGITGPAQLAFQNEEEILNLQDDPIRYNDEILWPEKVRINRRYVESWTFSKDIYYLVKTLF